MAFDQMTPRPSPARDGGSSEKRDPRAGTWDILRAVRDTRRTLGLRAAHIQTLQALLSFLRPGQGNVVFASNAELSRRAGNIDERTLRRHITRLQETGLLERQDSPNGKRYRVTSSQGMSLSFGLSLEPFFAASERLRRLAEDLEIEKREIRYLRKRVLVSLANIEAAAEGPTEVTTSMRRELRRSLSTAEYHQILAELPCPEVSDTPCAEEKSLANSAKMPANDGQNDRHYQKSEKERLESDHAKTLKVPEVIETCKEAMAFATSPIRTWDDLQRHAYDLAPMLGIDQQTYIQAAKTKGIQAATVTVLYLIQIAHRVRNLPAYFQSVTLGNRAASFDVARAVRRLAASCKHA